MAKKEKTASYKIAEAIVNSNSLSSYEDVKATIDSLQSDIVQILLNQEMKEHIGYNKNSHVDKNETNRRNGFSSKAKKVKTERGEITIDMPRDRVGSFEPKIIAKRQKVLSGIDDIVISMYAKGISLADISVLIEKMYKVKLSKETLSNMTEVVNNEVIKWQERKLKKLYTIVYVDCIYCNVKEDLTSKKKAVYVIIGIDINGKKEVLGIFIDTTESATFWQGIFENFKQRGVNDILFVCMDGLTGLTDAITRVFPKTITQRCIVHIVRNIYNSLNKKEAKEIIQDFKKIYSASNKSNAEAEYNNFKEKYKNNTILLKRIENIIDDVYSIFEYPVEIRKLIYTTNAIESVNSGLRKVTRGKGSFINETALMKVLFLRIKDLEIKWSKGTKNWRTIRCQLIELFKDRVLPYCDNLDE